MPPTLEYTCFMQVNFVLFITSFYIVSLVITNADKGKNEKKKTIITNNEKVIGLIDMLKILEH